jgi:hypothetical protein
MYLSYSDCNTAQHGTTQHRTADWSNAKHITGPCHVIARRPMLAWCLAPWRLAHRQCWQSSALEALEEGVDTNPLESPCHWLGDPGCEATDLAPGHRQPHPHQLAASNPDHVLHACNPTQNETKRGEPLPITGPGHAHMYPDAYTICHLSLATGNQSVALISNHHMSDSFERYLSACTPGSSSESDLSTFSVSVSICPKF